jgi:hypothetical protein
VLNGNISDAEGPQRHGFELYLDVEIFVADDRDAEWNDSAIKSTQAS